MIYGTDIRDFRMWFEYEHLRTPPKLLAEKYDITVSAVCKTMRTKHSRFSKRIIPKKWKTEPKWNNNEN